MTLLSLQNLRVMGGTQPVVQDVTLTVSPGEFIGLLGPNGAGKTTLMRAALGLIPHQGQSSLAALPPKARAHAAAYLPQSAQIAWALRVEALVALGRMPHGPAQSDHPAVTRALQRMDLTALRHRPATELSGGELARVLIARALAQEALFLMADEPVAGLDPGSQIRSMQLFADLAAQGGAVLASIHDLGLAARHCTRILVLEQGRLVADGPPDQVLTQTLMAKVFGIRAYYRQTEEGPVFQPLSLTTP